MLLKSRLYSFWRYAAVISIFAVLAFYIKCKKLENIQEEDNAADNYVYRFHWSWPGTMFSSLLSAKAINRFGTNKVSAFSTALTAAAMAGFSVPGNYYMLCLFAVPLGAGAYLLVFFIGMTETGLRVNKMFWSMK